ncbi:60S acidic ribosomal protein P0, putative [Cryptosporidium muris RN66]|uniref:60S acidic ribosomal protein P0 n=1 Tax=Cryptosporidium muris (strain RN66) TaxID=441375 RepID=B6ACX0_CRYMR|nr:60S acidic ribosomal protein P0, putative [Cryptosporidium muris RN66]EEA05974.1 60S acidic ribosomal protein P0, putative [Cryptosporidium muris RN66]|eukprot:XP_002140323.1 60S acidic ribosomal protein P0 [Cryptosporidium muris RN66]
MPSPEKAAKKKIYFERLAEYATSYPRILVANADHVGSKQMADIRLALRGKAAILMGKNTMIRTALKQMLTSHPEIEKLIDLIRLNIGLIFCIDEPSEVRKVISEYQVPAPARQGVIAPCDVTVPAGATGLDPSQTSFFQALGIATKIVKGQVEIQSDVHLIEEGKKVTASQAVLLQKLNIKPFSYGLKINSIYDHGSVYSSSVLDITPEDLISRVTEATKYIAALSKETGVPTLPSARDGIISAFRHCVALGIEAGFDFPQLQTIKDALANPQQHNVAVTSNASVPSAATVVEEEEEEEEDLGFSLFD